MIAFSPDGQTFLTPGTDVFTYVLWDTVTWELLLDPILRHQEAVKSAAFKPDGQLIAIGSKQGTIILWDVANQEEVVQLQGEQGDVTSLAFSPDGRSLATGSPQGDVTI